MINLLLNDKKRLEREAKEYASLLNGTEGALKYVNYLIDQLQSDSLSLDDLAKMTGADSIEVIKNDDSGRDNQTSISRDPGSIS